ncbi:Uncharacterised protein [Mycobacteroides abscessus subsp. abscessus]|nr:Uncharacterised protein [Mycobacteroides abscessus subsp. abscessus]
MTPRWRWTFSSTTGSSSYSSSRSVKSFCMDTFLVSGGQTETATSSTRIQQLQKATIFPAVCGAVPIQLICLSGRTQTG